MTNNGILFVMCSAVSGFTSGCDSSARTGPDAEFHADAGDRTDAGHSIGTCEFSTPPWSGGDYQGSDDALFVFTNDASTIQLRFVRRYIRPAGGRSTIFDVIGFEITHEGISDCVTNADAMTYSNTHHNWSDEIDVVVGDATWNFEWQLDRESTTTPYSYYVNASNSDGVILSRTALNLVSGPVLN